MQGLRSFREIQELLRKGDDDLLLEATVSFQAVVSIERSHLQSQDEQGTQIDGGWLVALGLPLQMEEGTCQPPFADGEPQMICSLTYMAGEQPDVGLEDALRALGIEHSAAIWQVRQAP